MNNAAVDIGVQGLFKFLLSILLDTSLGVELLVHVIISTFSFLRNFQLFFKVAAPIYIPTSKAQVFQFVTQHLFFLKEVIYFYMEGRKKERDVNI